MDLSRHIRLCTVAALSALFAASAHSSDCTSPVMLGEKPAMGAYGDYSDFLVAAMEHKSKEEEKRRHQKICPELYREAPIEGAQPETLESAIRKSADQPPFDYARNQRWYDRSTSQSFGLAGLPNNSMSGEAINTSLMVLDQGPLPEGLRNILLALQSPVDGYDNSGNALGVISRQFQDVLLKREVEVTMAFLFDSFTNRLSGMSMSGFEGNTLRLYLGDEGFLLIDASAQSEGCFSSCGEFGISINTR